MLWKHANASSFEPGSSCLVGLMDGVYVKQCQYLGMTTGEWPLASLNVTNGEIPEMRYFKKPLPAVTSKIPGPSIMLDR